MWAGKPKDKVQEFEKYLEQMLRRQDKDARQYGGRTGVVHIVDMDGFSLSHHASPKGK